MTHAFRMALQQFRLHKAFVLITVLVLGLGTGAASVVYTIVDTVVLRPLPYEAPDRLVKLWDTNLEKGLPRDPFSPVTFMDHKALPVFKDAAAWWRPDVNLVDPGIEPVKVKTIEASANLFAVLGVGPQLGEGFAKDGPFFSRTPVAVISDRLWRSRYAADPNVIGRQLSLNATPYTVVGVMPQGFQFPDDVDVWQRLSWDLSQHSRAAHFMEGVARLKDGVTLGEARAAADSLAARLGRDFASSNKGWAFAIVPLLNDQLGYYRPALYVLVGAVGLLFVIGCLNVASLMLTRALSREREMVVRTVIGAGPRHIVAQLLAESLLLSLAGAVAGVLVAVFTLPLIVSVMPVDLPRLADASVNGRVLAMALGMVAAMTVVFGLVPAFVLVRKNVGSDLKSGERGSSRGTRRTYQSLVVAEVALAAALLVSSGLLIRTVARMTDLPLGISADGVLLASIQISARNSSREAWEDVEARHRAILDAVRQQPGVRSAGSTNFLPLENGWRNPFARTDEPQGRSGDMPQVQHHSVSEGYFETMGVRLLQGRGFDERDTRDSEPSVIINETMARRYFAGTSAIDKTILSWAAQIGPLGRNLTWGSRPGGHLRQPTVRIVGVVSDIQNGALGLPPEPAIYATTRQFPFAAVTIAIAADNASAAAQAIRKAVASVSPNTPVGEMATWDERFRARTAEPRLLMTTLTIFGGIAGLLAALGVYGLLAWSVALRRRDLAIRLTLGAKPRAIAASVIRRSAALVVTGLIAGLALVQLGHGVLAKVLFGITPTDLPSMLGAALLLAAASLVASLPPAWRAMRVDTVDGLRAE